MSLNDNIDQTIRETPSSKHRDIDSHHFFERQCKLFCIGGKKYIQECTLDHIEDQNLYDMVRISKSIIINLQYLQEISSMNGELSQVKLVTGETFSLKGSTG